MDVTEVFRVFIFEDHMALYTRTHAKCFLCGKDVFFEAIQRNVIHKLYSNTPPLNKVLVLHVQETGMSAYIVHLYVTVYEKTRHMGGHAQ